MLNLSPQNNNTTDQTSMTALHRVEKINSSKKLIRAMSLLFFAVFIVTLLPWTQNIQSSGKVITLRPEQKPQTINTVISGKIEKWYVKDGDAVKKGDTILFISEVKDDYFDPNLINRTQQQLRTARQHLYDNLSNLHA